MSKAETHLERVKVLCKSATVDDNFFLEKLNNVDELLSMMNVLIHPPDLHLHTHI